MDKILHLSNLVFDIKTKITDSEYMSLMDGLSKINNNSLIDHKVFCSITTKIFAETEEIIMTTFNLLVQLPEETHFTFDQDWEVNFLLKKLIEKKGVIPIDQFPEIHDMYEKHNKNVDIHARFNNFYTICDSELEYLCVSPLENNVEAYL